MTQPICCFLTKSKSNSNGWYTYRQIGSVGRILLRPRHLPVALYLSNHRRGKTMCTKEKIRFRASRPSSEFGLHNPKLCEYWKERYSHRYVLPTSNHTVEALPNELDGTSSHTAWNWFYQSLESIDSRYEKIAMHLFKGGKGHCCELVDREKSILVIDGVVHFFQNKLDWVSYGRVYVHDFFSRAMRATLNDNELNQFDHLLGRIRQRSQQAFDRTFQELLQDFANTDSLQPKYETTYGRHIITGVEECLGALFEQRRLERRAAQVANFS